MNRKAFLRAGAASATLSALFLLASYALAQERDGFPLNESFIQLNTRVFDLHVDARDPRLGKVAHCHNVTDEVAAGAPLPADTRPEALTGCAPPLLPS